VTGDRGAYHWQTMWPWDYCGKWPWELNRHQREKAMLDDWSIEWSWHCPVFEIFRHRVRAGV
jgi:hypothetical protein